MSRGETLGKHRAKLTPRPGVKSCLQKSFCSSARSSLGKRQSEKRFRSLLLLRSRSVEASFPALHYFNCRDAITRNPLRPPIIPPPFPLLLSPHSPPPPHTLVNRLSSPTSSVAFVQPIPTKPPPGVINGVSSKTTRNPRHRTKQLADR